MFSAGRPPLSSWYIRGLWTGLALLAACAARAPRTSPATSDAMVENSIHVGLIETTFFVVDSVDGVKVHEKMDFERHVALAPGKHELAVTYYTDALWGSRDSTETCLATIEAEPEGRYRVEGEARHGEWRAHLVEEGTGREFPCRFAGESGSSTDRRTEETTAPAAAAVGTSSTAQAAGVEEGNAAPARTAAAAPAYETSRHRSFCRPGFYRVAHWEGDTTFVLERSDRVRLIGVQPDPAEAMPTDAMGIEGKCIRFDYEPTNLIDGHRDRNGRLLAYVYLEDGTFVNLELIREGLARASDERHRHLAEFLAAQSEARREGLGVWAR